MENVVKMIGVSITCGEKEQFGYCFDKGEIFCLVFNLNDYK